MSIVDIRTVEFDDTTELFHDRSTCSFDAEHVEDFDTAVGISTCKVHAGDAHNRLEVDTVRLKHPILFGLDATLVVGIHYIVLQKEHPVNARYAAQADGTQHRVLQLTQENVFLYCADPIVIFVSATENTTTYNQLLRVIPAPDNE